MGKIIRLTESQLIDAIKQVISEQGIVFNVGNKFNSTIVVNNLKRDWRTLRIDSIKGDTISVTDISDGKNERFTGIKDKSDRSGNKYNINGGYFILRNKK